MKLNLYPPPQRLLELPGNCRLNEIDFVVSDFSGSFAEHIRDFRHEFAVFMTLDADLRIGFTPLCCSVLKICRVILPDQRYRLEIMSDGIRIEAGNECSAWYALNLLRRIIRQCGHALPCLSVEDYPDFPIRGVFLNQLPNRMTLLSFIQQLAQANINQLQITVRDNFPLSQCKDIWSNEEILTADEILELDQVCRKYYIELVPFINSFGHFESFLREERYHHLAACPDGGFLFPWKDRAEFGTMLNPDEQSLDFLESIYDEIVPLFSSETVNIGCDELWELGEGRCSEECRERGKYRVYLDFICRIAANLAKRGKKVQIWADMLLQNPEIIQTVPDDMTSLLWGYNQNHPFEHDISFFEAAGKPAYICPGTSAFFSITGRSEIMHANLIDAAEAGFKHGACGYLNTDWEFFFRPWSIIYPAVAFGACCSWSLAASRDISPAAAANTIFLEGVAPELADFIWELGKLSAILGSDIIVNDRSTVYCLWEHRFDEKSIVEYGLDADRLARFRTRVDELRNMLAQLSLPGAKGNHSRLELELALDQAEMAGLFAGMLLHEDGLDLNRSHLLKQKILRGCEQQWSFHHRIGRLRTALEQITKRIEVYNV